MIKDSKVMNFKKNTAKHTMMVGTALGNKGGIESVVRGYFDAGITNRLRIHYYPTHCDGMRVEKILFYVKRLVKIITNMRQYRIVHVHTASIWSFRRLFPVILFAKMLHKKTVIHLHGAKFDIYYSQATNLEKFIIAYGFYITDKVVVLSREWLQKITTFCDSSKITIIPNSVPVNQLKENILKKKCEIPLTILFMGEIGQRKGVYDLLDAIKLLDLDNSQVKVLLCGNGEIEKVSKYVADLGLKEVVELPGWISGQEKKKLLDEAYLYVLPSYFEGLPMSILEALATGIPVITTHVGGIPDAVRDGYNGFLVPTNSPQQIADRIEKVLNDKNLWNRLSKNALLTIKDHFSMKQTEEKLCVLYESLRPIGLRKRIDA